MIACRTKRWFLGGLVALMAGSLAGCGPGGEGGEGGGDSTGAGTDTGSGVGAGPSGGGTLSCAVTAGDLAVSEGRATTPHVVFDGEKFLVAYSSLAADDGDVLVAVLDVEGKFVSETVIQSGPGKSALPSLQRDGDGYVVLWQEGDAATVVRARRIDAAGNPAGEAFDVVATGAAESRPVGAPTPEGVAVAWMDGGVAKLGFLQGSTLGGVRDVGPGGFPALGSGDGALGLAFSQGTQLGFASVAGANGSLDPQTIGGGGGEVLISSVAAGGGSFFVAWEDTRSGEEDVFLARVGADGSPGGEIRVPGEGGSANWPDVVFTGSSVAVAFYQFRDGPPGVFLTLLDPDLKKIGRDLLVSGDAAARFPSIAWTGEEFAIAYAEKEGQVLLSRVGCP